MKEYLFKHKSKIKFLFIIIQIILVMIVAGIDSAANRTYLYLLLFAIISHYGIELITESKFTNKQRVMRFVIAIVIIVAAEIILTQTNIL